MKTVKLGKTGLKVSRIGMGSIPIVRPTEDEAVKVIQRALDLGVTFVDTARRYGSSEERTYVDLWQFHGINTFEEYERVLGGAMEAAQEALQAGKIRHVGISSHSTEVALKAVSSGLFETIQFPFNFVNNDHPTIEPQTLDLECTLSSIMVLL